MIVKQETLPNGKVVSTVRLTSAKVYETMVFPRGGDWDGCDVLRYATRAEALAGHKRMVEKHS